MPIYEFACGDCGTTFERRVSFSADSTPSCAMCSSDNVRRQLSKPAIHFKGSGWYITDSKKSTNGDGKQSAAKTVSATSETSMASTGETTSSEKSPSEKSSSEQRAVAA